MGIARRAKSRAPMELLSDARVSREAGIDGDHRGTMESRQVTILAEPGWRAACAELGADLEWTTRRANLIVAGIDLENTQGARIRVGDVVLEITDELGPCRRMEEARAGLRKALTPEWRGGVSCRVIAGGSIRIGDPVTLVPAERAGR
jgi:MOSC domain-containing protein YiiM